MTINNLVNLLDSLISGVIGGIVVALLNHFLTRRKTEAEIRKIEAETEKIKAETKISISGVEATVSYKLTDTSERIIYDSTQEYDPYAFQGVEDQIWSEEKNGRTGAVGRGTLLIEKSNEGTVLNVQRTNTDGRYQIFLQKYHYGDIEKEVIPRNELIAGKRKIRVSCQAKVVDAEHSLRFVLRNVKTTNRLAESKIRISQDNWTPIDLFFQVPPTTNIQLRIDDEEVSKAPSSIQIRKLVLAEKI